MEFNHKPVLLDECIRSLNIKSDGIYLDCTIGGAGHSSEIYKRLGKDGVLVGLDQDEFALYTSRSRLLEVTGQAKKIFINSNFEYLKNVCIDNGISAVDGILMDLGVSSHQLDEAQRGFSYKRSAPLDMRMDRKQVLSADTIVNTYSEEELRNIIYSYGEEKWAARICEFIVKRRAEKRIETTDELVSIIKAAVPKGAREDGPHPAKRTFQAIRIAVNDELGVLKKAINDAVDMLIPGGRLCVITFHSLEDRIVKTEFAKMVNPCTCPPKFPVCVCNEKSKVKLVFKKPLLPSESELEENPRSRSAKLRVLERL